jgi:hypothetical protein
MKKLGRTRHVAIMLCGLSAATIPSRLSAQASAVPQSSSNGPASHAGGEHDFDFEIGTWKTHLRRLLKPLTGSTTWVEYDGTTVVRKVWGGAANLVELVVDGPAGHFEGLSLRLYDPHAKQWSLNFANRAGGTLSIPTIGEFRGGRGEFYDQEEVNGRAVLVRFVIVVVDADSCRFEQAYSADGGKSWEVNWTAIDTRVRTPDQPTR